MPSPPMTTLGERRHNGCRRDEAQRDTRKRTDFDTDAEWDTFEHDRKKARTTNLKPLTVAVENAIKRRRIARHAATMANKRVQAMAQGQEN